MPLRSFALRSFSLRIRSPRDITIAEKAVGRDIAYSQLTSPTMEGAIVQGDHIGCVKHPVDTITKVAF